MKESKIILLESSVRGNQEPFPPKTTHSPCCSFPAAECHYQSHYKVRPTPTVPLGTHAKTYLVENKLKARIFEILKEFPKIHLHFGTSFFSNTHAIDNRNLCKQSKVTLPIICWQGERIQQEVHWELAGRKAIFLCNETVAWHKYFKNLMAAEIKMPQRQKDTE